jgi:ABC-type antimicrobial peptide transport system permease subunit
VRDWTQQHTQLLPRGEDREAVMFMILTLIVAVAAFNIVSTLVMVVTDKQADIAILRTLGASPGSMMAIFMVQGAMIGVIGTLLGVAGGVRLALNLETIVPASRRARLRVPAEPTSTTSATCPRSCSGTTWGTIGGCARAVFAGHALPALARGAHPAGGGAAL